MRSQIRLYNKTPQKAIIKEDPQGKGRNQLILQTILVKNKTKDNKLYYEG